jgi:hypothetical protein
MQTWQISDKYGHQLGEPETPADEIARLVLING